MITISNTNFTHIIITALLAVFLIVVANQVSKAIQMTACLENNTASECKKLFSSASASVQLQSILETPDE